MTWVALW